jgi:N-acetyl-gamma-glutamyl-phosphate reductase
VQPLRWRQAAASCDLLFLALPGGVSKRAVPRLLRQPALRIIDLSADFRTGLSGAAYGLTEWNREAIQASRLVANPGCYPTAALLALGPLAEARVLQPRGVTVDAKSGVTGAGRSLREELLFPEVNEDLRAYQVNTHRHIPEMERALRRWSGRAIGVTFVPHLVPMQRGLYATVYAPLKRAMPERRIRAIFQKRYSAEPFIQLLPDGVWPHTRSVAGTNQCQIGVQADPRNRRAILTAAIDNLGKGAAGQAVQNLNVMLGFDETAGLR